MRSLVRGSDGCKAAPAPPWSLRSLYRRNHATVSPPFLKRGHQIPLQAQRVMQRKHWIAINLGDAVVHLNTCNVHEVLTVYQIEHYRYCEFLMCMCANPAGRKVGIYKSGVYVPADVQLGQSE